jgi:hypothetical protein
MPSNDDIQEIEQLQKDMRRLAKDLGVMLKKRPPDEPPLCSFCGVGRNNVETMFHGRGAYICSDCIAVCHGQLNAQK